LRVTVAPAVATATGSALVPVLSVVIPPAVATATAAGLIPTIVISGGAVTITPPVATATALGLVPNIAISITILAPVATATATGLVPSLVTIIIFIDGGDSTVTGVHGDSSISARDEDFGVVGMDMDSYIVDYGDVYGDMYDGGSAGIREADSLVTSLGS
jgi:hypothetical protein